MLALPRHLGIMSGVPGGCFNMYEGRPAGRWTILQWTNNMGRWSVARSDSPSCLLKQAFNMYCVMAGGLGV